MWPIMGAKSQNYYINDSGIQILLGGFFFAKGVPHLGRKYCFGQKFLFFARKFFGTEGTPFLDPVGGGGELGGESIELFKYLIRYS